MAPLARELRRKLETSVIAARDAAEGAAGAALSVLAVREEKPFAALNAEQRHLRNGLRARARGLGAGSVQTGLPLLVEEVAYEQWHRMLFARFLAENNLL